MRFLLKPGENPILVKSRHYPRDQRAFLGAYLAKLLDFDFAEKLPTASWQAAPLFVQKKGSRLKYTRAIELGPVSAATIKESWPMPHLDPEVLDSRGREYFAVLDFYVSAYWHLPLHRYSYTLCGIVGTKGVPVSKRIIPGLDNPTAYF